MEYKTIQYQSAQIHYRVAGTGKPVLLLHGFGEDGNIWKHQAAALQENFRLIIPDLPGSGRSGMTADMSIEGMAETLKAITDAELGTVQKFTLIGHSMGGYIALAFAEKYPEALSALGLFHSSAFADTEEKKATRLKAINFIQQNGSYEFLRTSIPGLFYNSGQSPENDIRMLVENGHAFLPGALVAYYTAMINRPDRTSILKKFTGPVLFICGLHDTAIPFAQSMQQVSLPSIAHIHILRQSAHMGMLEETQKANFALQAFLARAL